MLEEMTSPRTTLCPHFVKRFLGSRINSIAMLASPKSAFARNHSVEICLRLLKTILVGIPI
jgi:hypothetical protein